MATSLDTIQLRFDGFPIVDVRGQLSSMTMPLLEEPLKVGEEVDLVIRARCVASRYETQKDANGNSVVILKQFYRPVSAEYAGS